MLLLFQLLFQLLILLLLLMLLLSPFLLLLAVVADRQIVLQVLVAVLGEGGHDNDSRHVMTMSMTVGVRHEHHAGGEHASATLLLAHPAQALYREPLRFIYVIQKVKTLVYAVVTM